MNIVTMHDKKAIEDFLKNCNPYDNIYRLCDIDDRYWKYTQWYAAEEHGQIHALIPVFIKDGEPIVLASSFEGDEYMDRLMSGLTGLLPDSFYTHQNTDTANRLQKDYRLEKLFLFNNMGWTDRSAIQGMDISGVERLSSADLTDIVGLLEVSHPENMLDSDMVSEGEFFGIRQEGKLISIAGIHAISYRYQAAAVGNITTHPDYRGRGLCKKVSAALLQSLSGKIESIGLNVNSQNTPAISCYKKLGFTQAGSFAECIITKKL